MTKEQENKLRMTIVSLVIKRSGAPHVVSDEFNDYIDKWVGFFKDAIEDQSLSKET